MPARVAELVDARDLKSLGYFTCAGSIPASGITNPPFMVGFLLMIFERHANLKYQFGNRHFWSIGYYVSTVGLNEATIRKYIQDQEKEDILHDKLGIKEYNDPFKG